MKAKLIYVRWPEIVTKSIDSKQPNYLGSDPGPFVCFCVILGKLLKLSVSPLPHL